MSLLVHIWSDIACPWCYVGQKRLMTAANKLKLELLIEWHSFELDRTPRRGDDGRDYVQRLADKYGRTRDQAQGMVDQMKRTGEEVGIAFDFDNAVPANTFLAHRLLHLAKSISLSAQSDLKAALLVAHFIEGKDLNDQATLLSIAEAAGIDVERASSMFATDEFAQEVRDDEQAANELGVTGVPFFVIGKQGVGGAQMPEIFERVLLDALADLESSCALEGAVCTDDGC